MKPGKRQRALLGLAVLLLGLGMVAMVHHLRTKRAFANYQKQLIAAGEKLTVDEMTPRPAPLEQNGANTFYRALVLMNMLQNVFRTNAPASMTMVAPGKARVAWMQPEIRSARATNSWDDAIANASELAPALTLLEELIERNHLDFALNYKTGFSLLLPHLSQAKQAAQNLCYAALCDLHRGDTASATRRVRAVLAISQGSADECLVISQLVRIAITAIGSAGTWELLQSTNVTDAQLAQLQSDWSQLEFSRAAQNAVAMERAMNLMTAEQMLESSAEFRKITSGFAWPPATPTPRGDWFDRAEQFARETWDNGRLKAKETAWRFSWAYTDQLRTLQGLQALIDSIRRAQSNGNYVASFKDLEAQMTTLGFYDREIAEEPFPLLDGEVDIRTMFSKSILSLTPFFRKVMVAEANRQLVVTAIALQRYKLTNGDYPASLTELVPKFLTALPRDPADGKALKYKANSDGSFLLYSVGADGEDNGGDPNPAKPGSKTMHWQHCRDWVWPQPAKPQEVANFHQRESK